MLEFRIFTKVGSNKILNPNFLDFKITLNCKEETLSNYYAPKAGVAAAVPYYDGSSNNQMITLIVPKLETGAKSIPLKLSDLIER